MGRPILMMRWRSVSTPDNLVVKVNDGDVSSVGAAFGIDDSESNGVLATENRAIHWGNSIYALARESGSTWSLWRYDIKNNPNWVVDTQIPNAQNITPNGRGGFYPVTISGEPFAIAPYNVTSTTIAFCRIDKDNNVDFTSPVTHGDANRYDASSRSYNSTQVFKNNLYWWNAGAAGAAIIVYVYNPEANILTEAVMPTHDSITGADLCAFDGFMYINYSNTNYRLGRVEASVVEVISNLHVRPTRAFTEGMRPALFTDGTFLYSLGNGESLSGPATFDGWMCAQVNITPTGTFVTNITDTVLPDSVKLDGTANNTENTGRWWPFVDTETTPGSPLISLFFHDSLNVEGDAVNQYSWLGPSQQISFVAAAVDGFTFAMASEKVSSGHRVWSGSGELNSFCFNPVIGSTTIAFDYHIVGGSGQLASLQFFWDTEGEALRFPATILSTTLGTLVGQVTVSGVPTDGTTGTAVWAASSDGIVPGESPVIVGRILNV